MKSSPPKVLVIDLEATCADDGSIAPDQMEIIEVGAAWATLDGKVLDTFQRFVRPVVRPQLTAFCMELTTIGQAQIDGAGTWPAIVGDLDDFAHAHEGCCWGSWGAFDLRQVERESMRHGINSPLSHLQHENLKARFAKLRRIKQVGMKTALKLAGMSIEGAHHRALADALNISRLLPSCF